MTAEKREQEISRLRRRMAEALRKKQRKTAGLIFLRLNDLILRQLKYEMRRDAA